MSDVIPTKPAVSGKVIVPKPKTRLSPWSTARVARNYTRMFYNSFHVTYQGREYWRYDEIGVPWGKGEWADLSRQEIHSRLAELDKENKVTVEFIKEKLGVDLREQCSSCGERVEEGIGYNDGEYMPIFCKKCIDAAAEALRFLGAVSNDKET